MKAVDYMPSHFNNWNEDKKFRAAIFYLKKHSSHVKLSQLPRLQALMLHACKGSIRSNENLQDALSMNDEIVILQELRQIQNISQEQAKREFVNQVTKANPSWFKDVKMMIKFLKNPEKVTSDKAEDFKELLLLENQETDNGQANHQIASPKSQMDLDESDARSDLFQMNRSIRRDYNLISANQDKITQINELQSTNIMNKRNQSQQSKGDFNVVYNLLSENKAKLFSRVITHRQDNASKIPLSSRTMASSTSERFFQNTQFQKDDINLDQMSQKSIFKNSQLRKNIDLAPHNYQSISHTPQIASRIQLSHHSSRPLLSQFQEENGFKPKERSNTNSDYFINQVVEKAIKKDFMMFKPHSSFAQRKQQGIITPEAIPIRFSGDMLIEASQKETFAREISNFDELQRMLEPFTLDQDSLQQRRLELKNAKKIEDVDVDSINEDIARRVTIMESVIENFIQQKSKIQRKETNFLRVFFDIIKESIQLVQEMNWKLRETQETVNQDTLKLKSQVSDFINALEIVKEFKGMKEYDLFEAGQVSQEDLMLQFHKTSCQLKIQDEPLALKQAKILEEYYEFLKNQEKKILSAKKKIENLEQELQYSRIKTNEQLQKAYYDNQEICKLSDALKEKIEQTNYQQDNHLEQMYHSRQKILNDELEKETKEKQMALDRLRKKKEEIRKLREQITSLTSKKYTETSIQCNLEKEEKLKYHSRPKPPVTKLTTIFDEVIHGTSFKKVPTSKADNKNSQSATKAIVSSGAKAVVQPKEWVQALISLIYIDKIKTDMEEFKEGKPLSSLRDYVIQWFLAKFGVKKIAEALLQDFIRSLLNYEPIHERFRTFLIFCGIHVQKGLNRNRDKKSDLLYEKQLESIDTLRIYLKLIHTLRNGSTPFLPDINCEGQNRLANGVVINFNESKQIFLQIMTEEGINVTENFYNIDTPFQEFLEDQIIYNTEQKIKSKPALTPALKGQVTQKSKNQQDEKYINIDVFLRICIMEFVKVRLNQVDQMLSAIKILEFNNYCDILYTDFESSVKIALYNKSEKWIEGAYSYLINNLEDSYFTREDVVITMLPWIHQTAFVKDYTTKHKAWIYVKELERLNVLESGPQQEEKKTSGSTNQLTVQKATPKISVSSIAKPGALQASKINIPKSIVPGTKILKDPLSSAFVLERNFKIMASFFSSVESDLKEINQLYNLIMEKVTTTRKSFLTQIDTADVPQQDEAAQKLEAQMLYLTGNQKFIKTCSVNVGAELNDQTVDAWQMFRKLLYLVVSRHKNIDI